METGSDIPPMSGKVRDPLLQEREKTHGDFSTNAMISQRTKQVWRAESKNIGGYEGMRVEHKEALEMIALKVSRILSGQSSHEDHWDDIAGYAKLASEACGK